MHDALEVHLANLVHHQNIGRRGAWAFQGLAASWAAEAFWECGNIMKYYIHNAVGAKHHFSESNTPAGILILNLIGLLELNFKNSVIVLLPYFWPFSTCSVGTVER